MREITRAHSAPTHPSDRFLYMYMSFSQRWQNNEASNNKKKKNHLPPRLPYRGIYTSIYIARIGWILRRCAAAAPRT